MKIRIEATNLTEYMAGLEAQTGASRRTDGSGERLEWPEELGSGYFHGLQLRAGLDLMIHDSTFSQAFLLNGDFSGFNQVGFGFCLAGDMRYALEGSKDELRVCRDQSSLSFSPDFRGTATHAPRQRILMVGLGIEPSLLGTFVAGDEAGLPTPLRRILDGSQQTLFFDFRRITPAVRVVLSQLLACPYRGATQRLYLESKALELIALFLDQARDEAQSATAPLRATDVERIHAARDILLANIEEPPGLLALARQVGLNDCKLKRGFRQVFGTTAFGYLHAQRMERARQLLGENELNVAEVACAVGYTNPSHFSAAFRKKFGVSPRTYLTHAPRPTASG